MQTETLGLLSLAAAARVLKINPKTLKIAVASHDLPAVRLGRRLWVPEAVVRRCADGTAGR